MVNPRWRFDRPVCRGLQGKHNCPFTSETMVDVPIRAKRLKMHQKLVLSPNSSIVLLSLQQEQRCMSIGTLTANSLCFVSTRGQTNLPCSNPRSNYRPAYGYDCAKLAADNTELSVLAAGFSAAVETTYGTAFRSGPICLTIYPVTGDSADYAYDVSYVYSLLFLIYFFFTLTHFA